MGGAQLDADADWSSRDKAPVYRFQQQVGTLDAHEAADVGASSSVIILSGEKS